MSTSAGTYSPAAPIPIGICNMNLTRRHGRLRPPAKSLFTALITLLVVQPQSNARAHPADMYAQNFALSLNPRELQLHGQILPGPFLADAVWVAADLDQNGAVSDAEASAWIEPFITYLSVTLDGQALARAGRMDVHWPAVVDVLRTGEERIEFALQFDWPVDLSGPRTLEIHAQHLEANSLNWFSLSADGVSFTQPDQDNGALRTRIHFAAPTSPAGTLTAWNSGMPNLQGFSLAITQLGSDPNGARQPAEAQPAQGSSVTATLTGLVKTQEFSPLFLVGAFLLSLVLGSLHALTPGHGKALVGAYLVGSQGRTRDAIFLGAIVTLTHTGSVVLLGVATLFASHYILPALIAPWLEIMSGVLVIGFGLNLLLRRGSDLRRWLSRRDRDAAHHKHEQNHAHALGHAHPHPHALPHIHKHAASAQVRDEDRPTSRVTFRSLLALGISGGLVPCPDAIAILLVAVAVNRIPFGMLLILSFSLGLALVLIGIGIAMVNGVRLIARSETISRLAIYTPVLSAIVVTSLGAALTVSAARSLRFGTQVVESAAQAQASPAAGLGSTRLLYIAPDDAGRDQLFVQPLAGGQPAQLTREPAGITGYAVSPDRKTILYTLFQRHGGTAMWALDADGSTPRLILDCPVSECNAPRWYPDGTRLAYERLDAETQSLVPRFSIWWLDLSTGETRPAFQDEAFASYAPQFSPDGTWLSYVSGADNTLILFNLADGSSVALPLGPQVVLPAAWSPGSDAVLFGDQPQEGGQMQMRLYSLASGDITALLTSEGATDYSAAWSPDGSWIAINRSLPMGSSLNRNQVWLVRPDGTDARVLLQEQGASYSSLTWSPDAMQLLYARYVLDLTSSIPGRFVIYRVEIGSGESELLVEGGDMPALLP